MHRFYIPPSEWNPESLALDSAEAHHCHDVLRCEPGEKVVAFNGQGAEATATITSSSRSRVVLATQSVSKSAPPSASLTLCQAIPKGKNMDLIVQKATEMGAAAIIPLISERTVVRIDRKDAARKQAKWQRIAVEACKQSGQNWMPAVGVPITLDRYFESRPEADLKLIASLQPGASHLKEILAECETKPASALVLIGPEGDFTPAEVHVAKSNGCRPMTLGPIVLRTETAALYSLSILAYELF